MINDAGANCVSKTLQLVATVAALYYFSLGSKNTFARAHHWISL
jgi:hypothetical protein